jgi:phosphoglucosamine mutase
MSNLGLEIAMKNNGIAMHRAQVGDRFVVEKMRREGFCLGGEQSGHLIFLDSSTTGDGALAALKVLEIMKRTGKALSELKKQIHLFPQTLINLKVKERRPLEDLPAYQKALALAEKELMGNGRVFVRYSGTEAKLRILVESESEARNTEVAGRLQSALLEDLGI